MADEAAGRVLRGVGVSPGRGAGVVVRVTESVAEPPADLAATADAEGEAARALAALEAVAADLEERGNAAGGEARDVLEAQAMMARDPGLAAGVRRRTGEGAAAARAVYDAFDQYRDALAGAGDYLAARLADLDDVRDRAVARLLGVPAPGVPALTERSVVVGRDLAPADTALLDPELVAGLVTEEGGPTSHTAILSRALGVPAVVACVGAGEIPAGAVALVDGSTGDVVLDPPEADVAAARADASHRQQALASARAATGRGQACRLSDGTAIALLANVGGPADVSEAVNAGAEGVGLFRTELTFLGRATAPTEDEQTQLYAEVLSAFPDQRVVARVLDAGADKPLPFLRRREEPNPALGVRGIRALFAEPELLATQLRALVRAAQQTSARLEVMAPMVADEAEARDFAAACRSAGITGPVGVMIEVPAAAVRAGDILAEVDFVSLGTNDLAQYLFAADRQVGAVARLQDPWQPALLDLVATTAEAARASGKACGVCGEAAADPALACVLVGLGVTSLSAGAAALPAVRAALVASDLEQCRSAARAARAAVSAGEARGAAQAQLPTIDGGTATSTLGNVPE
jgi:phosphotransferase system enzyme I (PtsI)